MDNIPQSLAKQQPMSDIDVDDNSWYRVSPLAILYFIEKLFLGLLNNIFYMLPIFIVLWDEIKANPWIAAGIIGLIITLITIFAIWSFLVFRYRLSDGTVEVKSGIFAKKHVNLPFNRIQNVKIEQPFYYRLFNYSSMAFDSGGSLNQEARLIALPLAFAKELQQEINAFKPAIPLTNVEGTSFDEDGNPTNSQSATSNASIETVENTRSIGDLVLHGITSNRIYIILAAAAPFVNDIFEFLGDKLEGFGVDIQSHIDNDPVWQISIYAISLFLLVIGIMTILSIIGAIFMFYGYTLSRTEDKYIRRSGLITKHEVSVPFSRIQIAIMKQDFLDILFGRINLRLDQLNAQIANANVSQSGTNKLIVPSVFAYECRDIIAHVFPEHRLHEVAFKAISTRFIIRNISFIVVPITGMLSYIVYHNEGLSAWVVLVISGLLTAMVYGRWCRWGYQYNDAYIYIRKGLLGRDRYCLPITKIQRITYSQSWFMRKNKLVSLKIYLASGSYTIPMIDEDQAKRVYNYVLYKVESEAKAWM
jgi:putative membrane protein